MIQDIEPLKYDVTYKNIKADKNDYGICFSRDKVMMKKRRGNESASKFLTFEELDAAGMEEGLREKAVYLFAVDDYKFFLINPGYGEEESLMARLDGKPTPDGAVIGIQSINTFRTLEEGWLGFVGITAAQLYRWAANHRYCGTCGKPLRHSETERAFICDNCKNTQYPKISPAVIVGIVDGDKLLMTRYADRPYKKYALIAGFSEVGETLEDTVRREVMEEVGLKVKDITYYKCQPWSFSDSLLVGFFVKLDGDNTVTLDDGELAEGTWFSREEIPVNEEKIALTAEMIRYFAAGNDVFK